MTTSTLKHWLNGRTVIVTGHTGFKGSWLTAWLHSMGARVVGISLAPDQGEHALFTRANIAGLCESHIQDIRDYDAVKQIFRDTQPTLVFHLAAQALVRPSYADPLGTFSSNIMGTANVLEAARHTPSVKALVCVTTDKVYENPERNQSFVESDKLGGSDPYSASKSAAEMVARAYMHTLIPQGGDMELATARGGNVVGGGDWSQDRIIPDIIRAIQANQPLTLRNPQATRPWQHVLELCFGYMMLACRLENGRSSLRGAEHSEATKQSSTSEILDRHAALHSARDDGERIPRSHFRCEWNFGPEPENEVAVGTLVQKMVTSLNQPDYPIIHQSSQLHESTYLRLDSTKSKTQLGWKPLLSFDETIAWTCNWYRDYLAIPARAQELILQQIAGYEHLIDSQIPEL